MSKKFKFRHEYWGDEFLDAHEVISPGFNLFSFHQVAREIGSIFFHEAVNDDPNSFETYVEVMDENGLVRKFQVESEVSVNFNAYEHKEAR